MPLFKTISVAGGKIAVWQISESFAELASFFTPEELTNADLGKYTFEKRKVEWLASRLLIKELIGNDYRISYLDTGKPELHHADYKHISITHSRDFVAVFVHENMATGIDIESVGRDFQRVEKRYLSEKELQATGNDQNLHCLYWCAKEAIFKLVLDDGIEFRSQIRIEPFDYSTERSFTAHYISGEKTTRYSLFFDSFADQILVWVADSN